MGKGKKTWKRVSYYANGFISYFTPKFVHRYRMERLLETLSPAESEQLKKRVNYYCRFEGNPKLPAVNLYPEGSSTYNGFSVKLLKLSLPQFHMCM